MLSGRPEPQKSGIDFDDHTYHIESGFTHLSFPGSLEQLETEPHNDRSVGETQSGCVPKMTDTDANPAPKQYNDLLHLENASKGAAAQRVNDLEYELKVMKSALRQSDKEYQMNVKDLASACSSCDTLENIELNNTDEVSKAVHTTH